MIKQLDGTVSTTKERVLPKAEKPHEGDKHKKKVRVQFDFHPAALARLDDLTSRVGASSRAETLRRAVALYDRLVEAEDLGQELVLRTKQGHERTIWPLL